MRKKMLSIILMVVLVASLAGCGNSNEEKVDTSAKTESSATEIVENEPVADTEKATETESTKEKDAEASYSAEDYEEQKDIFVYKHIDSGDGTQIDFANEEQIDGPFILSESIDIYSYFFTYAGYTKHNIKVDIIRRIGDWVFVPFAKSSFLVKAEDFDRVAVLKEKTENTINEDNANAETESASTGQAKTASQNEGSANSEEEAAPASNTAPQEETPAPAVTTYSEEEVISIFRSTLESNGIQWYPSVYPNSEAGPSGGMGWGIENISMTDPYGDAAGTVEGLQFGGDKYYYIESQGSSNGYVHLKLYSG